MGAIGDSEGESDILQQQLAPSAIEELPNNAAFQVSSCEKKRGLIRTTDICNGTHLLLWLPI